MTLSNPPRVALWLSIPNNCRMAGEFEAGDEDIPDIHFILGSNGDDAHLLFEREALERFVALAQQTLAVPQPNDSKIPPPTILESTYGEDIRESVNRFAS